jgi:hypothetical protein
VASVGILPNYKSCDNSMHNSIFQDRDYQNFKKELPKYDSKDHRGAIVSVKKMEGIFESNPPLGVNEKK